MIQSIWHDIKRSFQYRNIITNIIMVNVLIFLILAILDRLSSVETSLHDSIIQFFSMPTDRWKLLYRPWAIVTSGFLHDGFFHVFWNMLAFYWFGRIVNDLVGHKKTIVIYVMSVIFGNIFFLFFFNFISHNNSFLGNYVLGASAAVMGMLGCSAYLAPNYIFNLLLFGKVKLKHIAIAIFLLEIIGILQESNVGGHISNIGGFAFGLFYAFQSRNRARKQNENDIKRYLDY
jgi:membrane associated rhomboid family serine protease